MLVCTPLVLLVWVAGLQLRDSQRQLDAEITRQNQARLEATAAPLHSRMEIVATSLRDSINQLTNRRRGKDKVSLPELNPTEIRRQLLRNPLAREVLIVNTSKGVISPQESSSSQAAIEQLYPRIQAMATARSDDPSAPPLSVGKWDVWFWQGGAQWLWVQQTPIGIVAIDLYRAAVVSRLINEITEPENTNFPSFEQFELKNASDQSLFQWGDSTEAQLPPSSTLRLKSPLSMWTLNLTTIDNNKSWYQTSPDFSVLIGLLLAAVIILLVAFLFYREQARESHEAKNRVSFVNQVSHELKTPLTNIRLYGDLARQSLDTDPELAQQQLDVIDDESSRLGRLINNVLSFAQHERQNLRIRPSSGHPDETIKKVVNQFSTAFEQAKIDVKLDLNTKSEARFDSDLLEQILYNLFSNACKYAPESQLQVTSSIKSDQLSIQVIDQGPGIPKRQREQVFQAFYRLSNAINEGQSGTGIGLGLARELARLHGGDLTLEKAAPKGCKFTITLTLA